MTSTESTLDEYPRRYCPICHNVVRSEFRPGPGGRPNASCPRCRSLDRHRFFAILLSMLEPVIDDVDVLLEVAPSPETSPLLAELDPGLHLKFDLGADNRLVDVLGSLTETPLRDGSVDLMVCYHVLEHIPDDRAAMREMARVLSPGGVALVQVPFRPGTVTDEDPDAPEEDRIRRFGQADHVRYYGDDFEDRMVEAGLAFQRVTPRSLLGDEMCEWLRLGPHQMVWIVRSAAGASVPGPLDESPTSLTRTLDAMLGEMVRMRGELVTHRREARRLGKEVERLRAENEQLRGGPPGSTVRKIARRAVRRR
ncbi:MAG: class I SAM-dependent methyltransferase [Actinomycetota bacterium]|nr:class I SAM-dependent methyltransferase [Actinomycetota bacterium]